MSENSIRSFVRRQGKMTKAQKDAVTKLSDQFCLSVIENKKLSLDRLFRNKKRFILEIGFGMGKATALIASDNPDTGFLGIEVHSPGVGKLLWEIEKQNLSNIKIFNGDAVPFLSNYIENHSFDGIHIFFPDPWPKKKHHKRRLINKDFIKLLAALLKTGGYIYITTDWEEYADAILKTLTENGDFKNLYDEFAEPQKWRPQTAFERKGINAERQIKEILFIRA